MKKKLLIVPPPQQGGGPSNAVLRFLKGAEEEINFTYNMFSFWDAALLNVGIGIRAEVMNAIKLTRRVVYRADGLFVRDIFENEGNTWLEEYEKTNARIKFALKTSDYVIYQSHFAKHHLDKLFYRQENYCISYNGVNLGVFSVENRERNPIPVIGCIGKFRLNRLQTIIDISKQITIPHKLLIVGRMDKECLNALQTYSDDQNRIPVEYIPPVTGDYELAKYHKKIDCFLHPFLSDWCPNAVVEALACGTPVVVPHNTGGSELIGDGGRTVYFDRWLDYHEFVKSFAYSTGEILESWERFSKNARRRAVDCLDINQMVPKYLEALVPEKRK